MKSISKIAKECGVSYQDIARIIHRDDLIVHQQDRPRILVTEKQEEYIIGILFFERKSNFITLESKMNYPDKPIELNGKSLNNYINEK